MTIEEIKLLIASKHNPNLATKPGMVHQIWEDGEHTGQKFGEPLWMRALHMFQSGVEGYNWPFDLCPAHETKHSYAFVSDEDAKMLHKVMEDFVDCLTQPKKVRKQYHDHKIHCHY